MEITASAKSGKTRFEIRLDPAELGRVELPASMSTAMAR